MKTREEILKRQQEILDTAKAAKRDLTADEQKEFDELTAALKALDAQKPAQPETTKPEDNTKAIEAERTRAAEITKICREHDMDADSFIRDGATVEQVRKMADMLEKMVQSRQPVTGVRVTQDEGDKFRAAASDGLIMRSGAYNIEKPAEGATSARNWNLRDLAKECLVRSGEKTDAEVRNMDADELFSEVMQRQAFNPSAAFPAILDTTIRKTVVELYKLMPTTFQLWTTKGSKQDFKEDTDHEYVINTLGDLDEIPENGELKNEVPETKLLPQSKLKTYGKQFTMTRQAFINDDIGLVTKLPGIYASKAKDTLDNLCYHILMDNAKIFDGKTLFHADHANIAATTDVPTEATMEEIITTMMTQKDQFGNPITVVPRFVLTAPQFQFAVWKLLHSAQVAGTDYNDANPLVSMGLQPIVTPKIAAFAGTGKAVPWFMVADPMSAKCIGVDYLNGNEMPTIRRMEAPGVLGFTWDVWIDAAVWVRDFRGIAKNPGKTA